MFNVLLIARPGMFRESLTAFFCSIPEIDVVSTAADLDAAFEFMSEHQPKIFVMDFSTLGNENENKIDRIKTICPQLETIALVDEVETKAQAELLGFDRIFINGSSVETLTKLISDCIEASISDLKNTE